MAFLTWRHGARALLALAMLGLAACGGQGPDNVKLPEVKMPALPPPPTGAPKLDPAALATPQYDAVLVAGDRSRPVGDDATQSLHELLAGAGTPFERLHMLSADPKRFVEDFYIAGNVRTSRDEDMPSQEERIRKIAGGTDPASPALVLRRTLELDGHNGDTCLVYLQSTPEDAGLKLRDGVLVPEQLDRALAAGCADAPTVVIVSGCSTGDWAKPPMARPNRLILAAAATGRTGFGCGPNVGFTTFDECLVGSIPGAPDWATIFTLTRTCVLRRESLVAQPSVDPQIYIGPLVARLPAPWRTTPGPEGIARQVNWRQGIGRFSIDGTPYFSTLKQRNQEALDSYRHAPPPRALALTLAGTVAWAGGVTGSETPEDVARIAVQLCEWQSDGACMLFARNDGLAANGPSGFPPFQAPMLARRGRVDPALVPFIREDQRAALAGYVAKPGAKALALGPANESFGIGSSKEAALAECERKGGPCVLYAVGDEIVLGEHP